MSDYLVTGKKGNGKSLVCVRRIADALKQGRRVATNLDLNLVPMLGSFAKDVQVIRLPDRPTIDDLECIGRGHEGDTYDESRNGLLVLDELATWMNSRTFNDKGRAAVLDWLAHSRKKAWDTYLIAQHPNQIDKQVREALCEYLVVCRRLDKLKWGPFRLPKMHLGIVKFGTQQDSLVAERWVYQGTDLYDAYDTQQVFKAQSDHGPYSMLPPWHQRGYRYIQPTTLQRILRQPLKLRPEYAQGEKRTFKRPEVRAAMRLPPEQRIRILNAVTCTG